MQYEVSTDREAVTFRTIDQAIQAANLACYMPFATQMYVRERLSRNLPASYSYEFATITITPKEETQSR